MGDFSRFDICEFIKTGGLGRYAFVRFIDRGLYVKELVLVEILELIKRALCLCRSFFFTKVNIGKFQILAQVYVGRELFCRWRFTCPVRNKTVYVNIRYVLVCSFGQVGMFINGYFIEVGYAQVLVAFDRYTFGLFTLSCGNFFRDYRDVPDILKTFIIFSKPTMLMRVA